MSGVSIIGFPSAPPSQIGSFRSVLSPFRIGGDSLFEFSGGPPSQGDSAHFTPVVSEVSALHQSVLELVLHALVVICGLEA